MFKFKLIIQFTLLLAVLFSMGVEIVYDVEIAVCEEFSETDTENETTEYESLVHDKTASNQTFSHSVTSTEDSPARDYRYQALIGSDFSKSHIIPPDILFCS